MHKVTRLRRRLGLRARTGLSDADRWAAYLSGVEPALAAAPGVRRFAQPPIIGATTLKPGELAVWIEGDLSSAAARRTLDALLLGSDRAAAVLHGSLEEALAHTQVDRLLLLGAGDVPAPLALQRFGQAVALAPDAAVITCDEDRLDAAGGRVAPRFRPGPSPDRWLACDDSGRSLVIDRRIAATIARQLHPGPAWRHELALRLAGTDGARSAHVPLLLTHRGPETGPEPVLEAEVVAEVLSASEPRARVKFTQDRVRWVRRPLDAEPSVEVVICLRDQAGLLDRCLHSLLEVTDYERLRVCLVDNDSREPETLELLSRCERRPGVRVLRDSRSFNFAALNNAAAASSTADVVVFLNNDTEIVQPDWITILLEEALRPEVGAVAPMLLFPDGTVQHAGAALGLHGYAGHPFAGLRPGTETPFGRAAGGTRNWLAVTAACLMVQRSKFTGVGGFDESFVVAGNDVDLCLRLTERGHRSLCVPHAVMIHDESRSRGSHIDPADFVRSEQSYGEFRTVGDPFYNPNLTLDATDCGVRIADQEA